MLLSGEACVVGGEVGMISLPAISTVSTTILITTILADIPIRTLILCNKTLINLYL